MPNESRRTTSRGVRFDNRLLARIEEERGETAFSDYVNAACEAQIARKQLLAEYALAASQARSDARKAHRKKADLSHFPVIPDLTRL